MKPPPLWLWALIAFTENTGEDYDEDDDYIDDEDDDYIYDDDDDDEDGEDDDNEEFEIMMMVSILAYI